MLELESRIEQMLNQADTWVPETFNSSLHTEFDLTQSLRAMARIKLNR